MIFTNTVNVKSEQQGIDIDVNIETDLSITDGVAQALAFNAADILARLGIPKCVFRLRASREQLDLTNKMAQWREQIIWPAVMEMIFDYPSNS